MNTGQNETTAQVVMIDAGLIEPNKGQIEGLPKNPRLIRNDAYRKLVDSLERDPEFFTKLNPLKVYSHGGRYVIIGGNMRYHASRDKRIADSWKQLPCLIVPEETDRETLERYILLDNASFGEWDPDEIANWDRDLLDQLCIDVPFQEEAQEEEAQEDDYDAEGNRPAEEKAKTHPGDIYQLGEHRLICGDSTDPAVLQRLCGTQLIDLLITDPPYNVNYQSKSTGKKIENDNMAGAVFQEFLTDAFTTANGVMKPGAPFYIWHADSEGYNFRAAAQRAGWTVRQCLIWNKNSLVLGRQDYQWKHEPCQPAGTMVLTTEGPKPIETLTDNDRVVSFDTFSGQVKGYRNGGYEIRTASRDYDGLMYSIRVGNRTTRATDNHQFSVRFNAASRKNYCTYLMRRGNWWRVGIAKAYDARQFGLKTRIHQERGDEAWIISMHADKIEAQVMEQILTCRYGIPYTVWETTAIQRRMKRDDEQVRRIYDALDPERMGKNAHRMLADFGRNPRYPLIDRESSAARFNTRVTIRVHACNLIPELMQVPVPAAPAASPNFRWQDITEVTFKQERCRVYSLSVDRYEHYVSDGIVTHNCLYGWKDGAGHYFTQRRDLTTVQETLEKADLNAMTKQEMKDLLQTIMDASKVPATVIDCDKPSKSEDHPTMKPLKLMGRLIQNSSRPGDIILDSFGGSGSTMMAAEQLGRRCYTVELDPTYCDVIVKRWEELTGRKAVLLEAGPEQEQEPKRQSNG